MGKRQLSSLVPCHSSCPVQLPQNLQRLPLLLNSLPHATLNTAGLDESVADVLLGLPDAPLPHPAAAHGWGAEPAEDSSAAAAAAVQQAGLGSPSSLRPPRPSSESLRGKSPEQVEAALMERLRKYVK